MMKKILLLVTILFAMLGFSQPIAVSSTSHTVPQLVNNVLINSPCVSATNITWSTGSNFGSSNGIGYFQNTNPNFPMKGGIVLSTGSAISAVGPNDSMLNDGSATWPGDVSLEGTLAAYGIPMVSKNATILEFDFTPISPNFSFNFIFASEEYGNFQCKYSDAFAFLLTNMNTGVTTNLAVVPNSNAPISVATIRDSQYNSSCPSENPQYFGSFNGGSETENSATNFNGQTKVLTASSVLTPNVPYHIKLVIADRLDPQSDSAIFISSDSFNIGQNVLGKDLTVANNNAVCFGRNQTLDTGLSVTNYTFEWAKDGTAISGQTGSTLTINEPGNYTVTYNRKTSLCLPVTDTITVEYLTETIIQNPNPIYKCDTGAATYTYNLDLNTPIVKDKLDPNTTVTYHISQNDAENNLNPLPLQYDSASGQTIYARIQLPDSPCFTVKTFQLKLSPPPVANKANDIVKCGQNKATFNLEAQTNTILGQQSPDIYTVKYYASSADANNGSNPIINTKNGLYSNTTIYARVQNITDPGCFSISSFNLGINPIPPIDKLKNVAVCSSYILPDLSDGDYFTSSGGKGLPLFAGTEIIESQTIYIFNQPDGPGTCSASSSFKVTVVNDSSLTPKDVTSCASYKLPKLTYGNYFTAPGGLGSVIPAGTIIATSQTIYYYYVTPEEPHCTVDTSFEVSIIPGAEVGERPDVFECTSYILPALSVGKYYTGPDGTGDVLEVGTEITASRTIYVYAAQSKTNPCSDEDTFEVIIGLPQPQDIVQCNGYTLPELPIGNYYTGPKGTGQQIPAGTVIEESTTVYIYAQTTSGGNNCTDDLHFNLSLSQPKIDIIKDATACESYTLPDLVNGEYYTGTEGSGTRLLSGSVILSTQTIFVFKRLNDSCYNQASFVVTINPLPRIDSRSDIDICDEYVLTPLKFGNYYTGPDGTGKMLTAGSAITSSQKIYIYAISNTTPACSVQNTFQINVFSATADLFKSVSACDSYTLPVLTQYNKYYTKSGGSNGGGTEIPAGTVITSSQTIYIFKEAEIRTAFTCTDETTFTVTINNTPIIPSIADVNSCESYTLPAITTGNYYTGPMASGTLLNAGDILTTSQTVYVYAHSATSPDCWSETSFKVTVFNVDNLSDVTICESFTLPNLSVGNYFTGPNGTGTMLTAGTVIKDNQVVFIYGNAPFSPSCNDESSFKITVIAPPVANIVPASMTTSCDDDGVNDGVTNFDLTTLSATALGTQTGGEFTIMYYENLNDAASQTNAITSTTLSTVYMRVSNTLAPNCYDIKPIKIVVNKIPEPKPVGGIICIDSKTGKLINPYTMYSGLTASNFIFTWTNQAGATVGHNSAYQANLPGVYTLVAKSKLTGCTSAPVSVTVNPSESPTVTYSINNDFSDDQSISVTATGQGNNFEYQLDNGQFQDNPIFEDVTSGVHQVTVRDKYGCGVTTVNAIVVNYQKFFTPNGDGYNDTWNITDLSNQPNTSIMIYDRYGKVIQHITPNNSGWDGTYNGNQLPADDYWFTVSYKDENDTNQEFRSHFTLKR